MTSYSVFWLFGLPSAGKTTLAHILRDHLRSEKHPTVVLDGDELRSGLCAGLGFSDDDRAENIRRAAEVARLLCDQGCNVICAFITPKEAHRSLVRQILGPRVRLVHVDCPLQVCVRRDVKGLYQKAARQQMQGMTGTQDSFIPPEQPDLIVNTHEMGVHECCRSILDSHAGNNQQRTHEARAHA